MFISFKDVLDDCARGMQNCFVCPAIECCDNGSPLKKELRALRNFAQEVTKDLLIPKKRDKDYLCPNCGCNPKEPSPCDYCQYHISKGGRCTSVVIGACPECLCVWNPSENIDRRR